MWSLKPKKNFSGRAPVALSVLMVVFPLCCFAQTARPSKTSVDNVVSMVEAGVSEDLIIDRLRKDDHPFDLSSDDLIRLRKANVSANIVKVMIDPHAQLLPSQQAVPSQGQIALPTTTIPGLPTATATPPGLVQQNSTPPSVRFDTAAKSVVVTRSDGATVSFVGEDIKIAGFFTQGIMPGTVIVRHKKAGVSSFLQRYSGSLRGGGGPQGGSGTGAGELFIQENGGVIYDSGVGAVDLQENQMVLVAKRLAQVIVDAVDEIHKEPGHEKFVPQGYDDLKTISQYRLRQDGSR